MKFDEVTDEEWKALADFVRCDLEALKGYFEWKKIEDMVQALVNRVADVCKHHMDVAVTR